MYPDRLPWLAAVVSAALLSLLGPARLPAQTNSATTVSAATFSAEVGIPRGSLVTTFMAAPFTGQGGSATTIPLPIQLGGITIKIVDALGREGFAGLIFVSATQFNWVFPDWPSTGEATVTFRASDATEVTESINVTDVAPGLFQINSQGVAAGTFTKRSSAGDETGLLHFCPAELPECVQKPLPVASDGEVLFFSLFGSGFRFASSVRVFAGDVELPVLGAAPQGSFEGLDQVNVGVTPEVRSRVDQLLTVDADGLRSNAVQVTFGPAPPAILALAPATGSPGYSGSYAITGTRLHDTSAVVFEPSAGLTVENIEKSYNRLTFALRIATDAPLGVRRLRVRSPEGESFPLDFEVREKPPGPTLSNFRFGGAGLILTNSGGVINIRELAFDFTDDDGDIVNPAEDFSVAPRAGVANLEVRIIDNGRSCFAFNGTAPFLHRPAELSGHVGSLIPILVQATQPSTLGTQAEITLIDAAGKRSNTVVVADPVIGCRAN